MRTKNYLTRFNIILMFTTLICIVYSIIALEWDYLEDRNHYGMIVLAIGYVTGIITCITAYKYFQPFAIIICLVYGLQVIFSIIVSGTEENLLDAIIKNTIWIIIFFMAYLWGKNNYKIDYAVKVINYYIIPLLCIMYVKILSTSLYIGDFTRFRDAIFPIAVLSPFILFCRNIKIRILLFAIIIGFIFVSAKRSVILGAALGLFVYMLKIYKYSTHRKVLLLYAFVISSISLIVLMVSNFDFEIFDFALSRFDTMAEGDSNGRDTIINHILYAYQNSDFINQIFGHGPQSTIIIIGKLAHNDIIQVLYDYGWFTLISFVLFYVALIYTGIKLFRNHNFNERNAIFCYNLILFIILGMLNCYISTPRTFTISMFIFGYIIGKNDTQLKSNSMKNSTLNNQYIHYHHK